MTAPDIDGLVERLEKASGPDRELDGLIAAVVGVDHGPSTSIEDGGKVYHSTDEVAPRFTESIDAALTLVPEGWRWSVGVTDGDRAFHATVRHPNEGNDPALKWGAVSRINVPLALCIAALRARTSR